jgi:hypothetical protein
MTSTMASAGAKGPLVEEEARLLRLRQEVEGEAREELQKARVVLEDEARTSASGKLCATPFGVDVVGITEVIALTGALVGGELPRAPALPCAQQCPHAPQSLSLSSICSCEWHGRG